MKNKKFTFWLYIEEEVDIDCGYEDDIIISHLEEWCIANYKKFSPEETENYGYEEITE